jgi:hypothetical protein
MIDVSAVGDRGGQVRDLPREDRPNRQELLEPRPGPDGLNAVPHVPTWTMACSPAEFQIWLGLQLIRSRCTVAIKFRCYSVPMSGKQGVANAMTY